MGWGREIAAGRREEMVEETIAELGRGLTGSFQKEKETVVQNDLYFIS